MQKREGSDPKMDAKHYLEIIKEQKAYYERDVQKQLLAGKGVKEEILNLCDEYISIDMNKSCESLNVAVATSIILYEINR